MSMTASLLIIFTVSDYKRMDVEQVIFCMRTVVHHLYLLSV